MKITKLLYDEKFMSLKMSDRKMRKNRKYYKQQSNKIEN